MCQAISRDFGKSAPKVSPVRRLCQPDISIEAAPRWRTGWTSGRILLQKAREDGIDGEYHRQQPEHGRDRGQQYGAHTLRRRAQNRLRRSNLLAHVSKRLIGIEVGIDERPHCVLPFSSRTASGSAVPVSVRSDAWHDGDRMKDHGIGCIDRLDAEHTCISSSSAPFALSCGVMDIDKARTFLAIAAHGSFLEAAKRLHLTHTPSTASTIRICSARRRSSILAGSRFNWSLNWSLPTAAPASCPSAWHAP